MPADGPARKCRVLVIDDDAHVRDLASTVFATAGNFEPIPVADAIAFGEALAKGAYDAVVLEPNLRWADGLDVLEAVKRAGRERAVVLFTAPGQDELVLKAFRRGLDESVPKSPRGFVELPLVVRATLERLAQEENTPERRVTQLLERLNRPVFHCDLDGRMLEVNRAFVEQLGFESREDALRANAFALCLPAPSRAALLQQLEDRGFLQLTGVSVPNANGRWLTVTATLALSTAADAERGRPVTGLLEREPQQRTAAPLDTIGSRAMIVAHDLKEPLRTIVRTTEQLRERLGERLEPDAREQLAFLDEAAQRMQLQLQRLFEKPAGSGFSVSPVVPPPRDREREREPDGETHAESSAVLHQVMENLRAAIEASGARITTDTLPAVAVPPDALLQLFQNLLANALNYRRDEPPHVHISAELRDDQWRFSVADNGIGIPETEQERIFEMFERGSGGAKFPGTGIGLAVCRRIVEQAGGTIWVKSREGEGATFFFSLPAAR